VPIYEYRCPNGHVFEVFQRIDDPNPDECEVCSASPLQRVLTPVAVHFKGSGFYSTDYGRKRKVREGGESSSSSDSGGSGGEKPAEKKESKSPAD
jgi:putative FmdB family regulatory protein